MSTISLNTTNKTLSKKDKAKDKLKSDKKNGLNEKLSAQSLQQQRINKLKEYFSEITGRKLSQSDLTGQGINIFNVHKSISNLIQAGTILIPQQTHQIESLLKPLQPANQASLSQMQAYQKQAKRIQHLKLISNINKQLQNKMSEEQIPYILTREQHQRKVRDIVGEKKARDNKAEQKRKAQHQKDLIREKQQIQLIKQQQIKHKQHKRLAIEEKITKQKEQHIHFLSQEIKHQKDFQNLANQQPLFIKMENQFKHSIQIPALQQKKMQYKRLRQFRQKYNLEAVKSHQQQYLNKKSWKLSQSKLQPLRISSQHKQKLPTRSSRLQQILDQQALTIHQKLTSRQRYIQEKLRKEEDFIKRLKDYQPKISIEKQEEIENRLRREKSHLSKLDLNRDYKKIGLQYLTQSKQLIKDRTNSLKDKNQETQSILYTYHSQILLPLKRATSELSLSRINSHSQFIEKQRDRKINKILNSEEDPQKKFSKLKIQTDKITEAKHMKLGFFKHNFSCESSKQASILALTSIKAKLSLIQLTKQK